MKLFKKVASVALAATLAFTLVVPANAEKGYDTDNKDKWDGLKIVTDEVPQPENKDIYFDGDGNIVSKPNVQFQLDAVIDSEWKVSPAGEGVSVNSKGLVSIKSDATSDTIYTVTATPENITTKGAEASIKIKIPANVKNAVASDVSYADSMVEQGVELSADKKTITVTGARSDIHLETEVTPAYILESSVSYATDKGGGIEIAGSTLTTTAVTDNNVINCTIGSETSTKPLNVTVKANELTADIASDDVAINDDREATVAMDQQVEFYAAQNSDVALEENGTVSLSDYTFNVTGDDVEQDAHDEDLYNLFARDKDNNQINIGTLEIQNTGSAAIKAVVTTDKLDKNNEWNSAKRVTLTMSYNKKEAKASTTQPVTTRKVTLMFQKKNATFNSVKLDFAQSDLEQDVNYSVSDEEITYVDKDNNIVTKNMPVYYFESTGGSLDLAKYTFADGDYKSTVRTFNVDKENGFSTDNLNYDISYTLSDIKVVEAQQNNSIGVQGVDVNKQNKLYQKTGPDAAICDRLELKGIGYKLIRVSYERNDSYCVVRFVSPSRNLKSSLTMLKRDGVYYDLENETVHVRKGEAVKPQYKDTLDEIKNATLNDPFLEYSVVNTKVADKFVNGAGEYQIGGKTNGKTTVEVTGKVNKQNIASFTVYVNNDAYTYEENTFEIDYTAAIEQGVMNEDKQIDGRRSSVPVNVEVVKTGAALPDVTWKLMVRDKDNDKDNDAFKELDDSIATIAAGDENGSAIITTKKSADDRIYVCAYSGNTLLCKQYFTITKYNATGIKEIAEQITGNTSVVKNPGQNKGTVSAGSTFVLQPVVYEPENATDLSGTLEWSSDDETIATVNKATGKVTALKAGKANIVATYISDGKQSVLSYALTVEQADIPVTGINCATTMELTRIDATGSIEATVVPANATNKALRYEVTEGKDVVSVSATGVVTAKKVGTATITVTAVSDSTVMKTITVTVKGEADKPITKPDTTTQAPAATTQAPATTTAAAPTTEAPAAVTAPAKVKISSAKNVKGKKLTIKFKKITGAKSYQIVYSLKKNFKGKKTINTTKTSYTIKKLKKGKTYYVKVRAKNTAGFGKFSAVKKVKIKK